MLLDTARFSLIPWLEEHFRVFQADAMRLAPEDIIPWPDYTASTQPWLCTPLYEKGSTHPKVLDREHAARIAPESVRLLASQDSIIAAGFSILTPGTHILAHTDFKTDATIRTHLGLVMPAESAIRVGDQIKHINEGEAIVFEGRIDHEAANAGAYPRIVLLVDFVLTDAERAYVAESMQRTDPRWLQTGAGAGLFGLNDLLALGSN